MENDAVEVPLSLPVREEERLDGLRLWLDVSELLAVSLTLSDVASVAETLVLALSVDKENDADKLADHVPEELKLQDRLGVKLPEQLVLPVSEAVTETLVESVHDKLLGVEDSEAVPLTVRLSLDVSDLPELELRVSVPLHVCDAVPELDMEGEGL